MDIHHWVISVTVSILSSLGVFVSNAWAETKQVDFTSSFQSNQTDVISQVNLTLNSESYQTFSALMQQAEVLATGFLDQEFAKNLRLTKISVSILGERNGQEVPLLFSTVSRSDWQRQPIVQRWTRYFNTSAVLLGFLKPQSQPSASTTFGNTSVQQSTSPASEDTSVQQSTPPTSEDTSVPDRANLEEGDSGIR